MNFSIGIIGLPNVGKSTLFKALTKQQVDISNYPFTTIDPNIGIIKVPDERLEKIAAVTKPQKITPTVIEFVDIAGLVKNAHKGEGLGNQFLARIREVDAICQVARAFENEKITHTEGQTNPERDIEIINTELIMKDLETLEKRLEKVKKETKGGQKAAVQELEELNIIKEKLTAGSNWWQPPVLGGCPQASTLQLLTAKPMVYVFNIGSAGQTKNIAPLKDAILVDLKYESELSELTPEEAKELELPPSKLNELIKACYEALNLITFYTVVGKEESRAWTLKNGLKAQEAGGKVHTDFEKNFIRAEVINWQKLIEAGSWSATREKGWLKIEGKEYVVQDGDVIEFKI